MTTATFLLEQADQERQNRYRSIQVSSHLLPLWQRVAEAERAAQSYGWETCKAQLTMVRKHLEEAEAALENHAGVPGKGDR